MERKEWRFVDFGMQPLTPLEAALEVIPRFVERGVAPSTVCIVKNSTFDVTMGGHEDIDSVIDLQKARELGIDVVRAWRGGGTIWLPPYPGVTGILGYAISKEDIQNVEGMANLYVEVSREVAKELGLPDVDVVGSGDVRHQGIRKVGSSTVDRLGTIYCSEGGGFFANKVSDFHFDLYLDFARIPAAKFKDKAVKEMSQYIAGVSDIAGRDISYEEIKQAFVKSIEKVANVKLVEGKFMPEEEEAIAEHLRVIRSEPWLLRKSSSRFRAKNEGYKLGFAEEKYKKLVQFNVAVEPETNELKDVMISGDMYISPLETVDDMEGVLRGAKATDKELLLKRIKDVLLRPEVETAEIHKVTPEEYCSLLEKAIEVALQG
jgi:lipoate-protein ligase A